MGFTVSHLPSETTVEVELEKRGDRKLHYWNTIGT